MRKKLLFLILLLASWISSAQVNELSKVISDTLNKIETEARINRIAKSAGVFKDDDIFTIKATFELNKEGRLVNITVRAPHPGFDETIKLKLQSVKLDQNLLNTLNSKYFETPLTLPIRYQVKSENEIRRLIKKDKKRKAKLNKRNN